jgi:hypothetical protein
MSTTQHTGHYNLPTFGDNPNDRPSWRGDFTDAMTKIDNQMYANATNITTATAAANNAKTAADAAKESADIASELAQTNKTDIAELNDYFSKLGVTSSASAQNLKDTINGKAENTALQALQGTVSGLSDSLESKANTSEVYSKAQTDTTFTKQGGYSGTAQQIVSLVNGKADLSDVYTRQQADDKFAPNPDNQNILVAIGDSYFEGFRTTTPTTDSMIVVASQMLGLTCHNFAVGAAGFIAGGASTFSKQLDTANTQVADKTKVKYVVIGGGRNDDWNTLTESDVKTTLQKAVTLFPYSKIVFIPMMWDNTWPSWHQGIAYGKMVAGGRGVPQVSVIRDAPTWGLFWDGGMTDIHPNTEGSRVYAQYIASACENGHAKRSEILKMNVSGFTGDAEVIIDGLDVSLNGRGNKTQWNQQEFATIPGASAFGAWDALIGWMDSGHFLKLKFTGSALSVIDVLDGNGQAGNISFSNTMSVFAHN